MSYMTGVIFISYFRTTSKFFPVKKPLLQNRAVYWLKPVIYRLL